MKWMAIRTFLRGGYADVTEPTIVTRNGVPYLTVLPGLVTRTDDSSRETSVVLSSAQQKKENSSRG
jgi:hypothetical protein